MPITTPPATPQRTEKDSFSARMDAYLSWITNSLVPGLNDYSGVTASGAFTDGSAALPGLAFISDTDTGIWRPSGNTLAFSTGGTEAMRVNAGGNLFINCINFPSLSGFGGAGRINIQGLTNPTSSIITMRSSVDSGGPSLALAKSRGGAVDNYAVVAAADFLGFLGFYGADGTSCILSSRITSQVIGTPAAGDVRGNLIFQTGNAAGAVATRLTIGDADITATIPFDLANGSVTAPSLAFASSPATGIYRAGANALSFASNGVESLRIDASGNIFCVAGRFGYPTGAGRGGTITQITSRTTGVTIGVPCGEITLFSAAGSPTVTSFVVTHGGFLATDAVIVNVKSGTNTYNAWVSAKATGSFTISFVAESGTAVDAPVISFMVLKGTAN